MISFSIDKQSGKVNVERMSRPVDSIKNKTKDQPLVLVLTSAEQSPTFASRLKKETFGWPNYKGSLQLDWTDMRIENLLTQKLPAKLRAKGIVGSPTFYLQPVLWGSHKSISKFVEYYKTKNPIYPNCLVPCCFMSYTYKDINEPVHKFGSIDTILKD